MAYEIIHPPKTTEQFRKLPSSELRKYFDRFLATRQERINALQYAITESGHLQDWASDLSSAESVRFVGEWFTMQVAVRPRTTQEMEELRKKSLPDVEIEDQELTDRTFSLAFDVGLYFGETLVRAYPHLEWWQFLDDKLFVDYGQPVLIGFGRVPLNPFRIVVTLAYGIAKGQHKEDRFLELYIYWAARAATSGGYNLTGS